MTSFRIIFVRSFYYTIIFFTYSRDQTAIVIKLHLGIDVLRRIAITLNQLTHIVKLQLTAFAHLVLFQAYLYITLQVECRKASNSSISLFTCLQALLVHKFYILILIHKKDFYHTIACLIIFQKGIPIKRFDIRVRFSYINSYKRPVIN